MPPRRQPGQSAPKPTSPTGNTNGKAADFDAGAQSGERLTTAQGLRVEDADNSLTAGDRGPTLLEDFHLRERSCISITSASLSGSCTPRGGAHGVFQTYGTPSL